MNDRIANDRIALATTDASVAVLSTAVEAFYEADFCSNCLQHAHQLRVFAVRTERAFSLMGRRQGGLLLRGGYHDHLDYFQSMALH